MLYWEAMNELVVLPTDTQQIIQDLLANEWSPTRIARHLRKLGYSTTVSEVEEEALELISGPDIYIDSYNEMGRVLQMMAARLEHTKTMTELDPKFTKDFLRVAKDYFVMLQEYSLLGLKLGEIPEVIETLDGGANMQSVTVQEVLAQQQKVEVQIHVKE